MSIRNEIINKLQGLADDSGIKDLRVTFGTPGDTVTIGEVKMDTGKGLEPEPTTFTLFSDAVSDVLERHRGKINEIVREYNKLRDDYNDEDVPTHADSISEL